MRAALLALLLCAGCTLEVHPERLQIRQANVVVSCQRCVIQYGAVIAPTGNLTVQRVAKFAAVAERH